MCIVTTALLSVATKYEQVSRYTVNGGLFAQEIVFSDSPLNASQQPY